MLENFMTVLFCFQIKHFLCDFILQNSYMLGKFKSGLDWIKPLSLHCFVNAIGTFVVCYPIVGIKILLLLSIFDFLTHFVIDRVKASPNILGRFKPTQTQFWLALGFDQMMHQIIYIVIVYFMFNNL